MCHAGGTYLKAQLIILALISGVCIAGLFLTGNSYAILAGVLIGMSDALPFIGTGLVFIPWLIIDLFRGKYFAAVIYGILFILSTFIREFMEPRLMGRGLGVHPLAVIISIYAGLKIYGTAGVILGPLSWIFNLGNLSQYLWKRGKRDNMKIVCIYGQNHKGSTYHIAKIPWD